MSNESPGRVALLATCCREFVAIHIHTHTYTHLPTHTPMYTNI